MKLFVESRGSGDNIVLLHGWGFNSAVWDRVANELAKTHCVTLIDLPGFGRSVGVDCDYELGSLIELIVKQIPENSILLGWSMGGLIAQGIALKYPQHLKRLILLASNAQFMVTDHWPHAMKTQVLEGFIEDLVGNFKRTLHVFLMLQAQGGDNARETIRELKGKLFAHGEPNEAALRGGLMLLKNVSFVSTLNDLKLPVDLMFGRLDKLVPIGAGEMMHQQIPHSRLHVFEHASHAPFISHYDEFMKVIKRVIE